MTGARPTAKSQRPTANYELVVIGCSLGGMHALHTILSRLPGDFCVPIVVAQHRHKKSDDGLPEYFRRNTQLNVVDAEDKQWIKPSHVYLAPADYHLLVERNDERGELHLSLEEPVRFSRPSIDVLFDSAADAYGPQLIGVVLTGSNEDGARGAKCIKERGGIVVVQDPRTAEAPEMPSAVAGTVKVDRVLPLEGIATFLAEVCRTAVGRR
jgi:two-component system chemotaxis response regulator CheB